MNLTIIPHKLAGTVQAISSKSQIHRLLICSALADGETHLICREPGADIDATAGCLQALGADILPTPDGYRIFPIRSLPKTAVLDCGESGSTLRFLLPITAALGVEATFRMSGRLPCRPLSPLGEEMERMGCRLSRPQSDSILCRGKLIPGDYTIDGGVSSQYITGLLFAASVLPGDSRIHITGDLESKPYLAMTQQAMAQFGIHTEGLRIAGGQHYHSPGTISAEGDWSNAACFLAAAALGCDVSVTGLDPQSHQGDRAAAMLLPLLRENRTIHAADIPDLIPILSVVAAANQGAVFTGIRRLRLKESDRVQAVISMLEALGGSAKADENTLTIYPARLTGGQVDVHGDHRIAMATAIASVVCSRPVRIPDAQCVAKSDPGFWDTFRRLGGKYEQYLR